MVREQLGLLEHRVRGGLLLVGRVAVFAEDAFDDNAELGPDGFLDGPVDADVPSDGVDQLAGDRAERSASACGTLPRCPAPEPWVDAVQGLAQATFQDDLGVARPLAAGSPGAMVGPATNA